MSHSLTVKQEEAKASPQEHLHQQLLISSPMTSSSQQAPSTSFATHTPLPPPPNMYPVQTSPMATLSAPVSSTYPGGASDPEMNLSTHPNALQNDLLRAISGRPRDPRLQEPASYVQQLVVVPQQAAILQQSPTHQQASLCQQSPLPQQSPQYSRSPTPQHTLQLQQISAAAPLSLKQQVPPPVSQLQSFIPYQQPLQMSQADLSLTKQEADRRTLLEKCKEQLSNIRRAQQVLNAKKMEVSLHYSTMMEQLPLDENRPALLEQINKTLDDALDKFKPEERILQEQFIRMKTYVTRAEALNAEDENDTSTVTSLFPTLSGGSHQEPIWISPNDTDHHKVKRVATVFCINHVPVTDLNTMQVDYSRLKPPIIDKSPVLDLGLHATMPKTLVALKVLEQLENFLARFQSIYKMLDEILFDDIAFLFMGSALKPAGYASAYRAAIQDPKYGDKKWDDVVRCVNDILMVDRARYEVLKHLMSIKPLPNESMGPFVDRIESMIRVSGAESYSSLVARAIVVSLPLEGCKKLELQFGDLNNIEDISKLLSYMRRHGDMLDGAPAGNPYDLWLKSPNSVVTTGKTTAEPTGKSKRITVEPTSRTIPPVALSNGHSNNSSDYRNNSQDRNTPKTSPSHSSSPAEKGRHVSSSGNGSNHKREHSSKPYARPPHSNSDRSSRERAPDDRLCQLPMCVDRNLVHSASKCFSITNPKKYEAMLRTYYPRPR